MRKALTWSGIFLAAIVASLTGCGGGDPKPAAAAPTPSPTTTPTVVSTATPAPVGDRLSHLCRDVNKDADRLNEQGEQLLESERYDDAAKLLREGLKVAAAFDRKVEALEPPADEAKAFRRYVEANQRLRRLVTQLADALEVRDFGAAREASDASDRVLQVRLDAALELGADDCGS